MASLPDRSLSSYATSELRCSGGDPLYGGAHGVLSPKPPDGSDVPSLTHRYEVIDHTADTGIKTGGDTLADAIGNAAFAMFDLMYDLSSLSAETLITLKTAAVSPPELLVDVLSELLLHSETDDLVFTEFRIHEAGMHATVDTAGASTLGLELRGPPIKAVTYHDLRCEPVGDAWEIRVIFDV